MFSNPPQGSGQSDPSIAERAEHFASSFLYQVQNASNDLINSGIENEIQSASFTAQLGKYLEGVTNDENAVLTQDLNAIANDAEKKDQYKIQEDTTKYNMDQQSAQNKESRINSSVQTEQETTSQAAKAQQNAVQFAQAIQDLNGYLSNLLAAGMLG